VKEFIPTSVPSAIIDSKIVVVVPVFGIHEIFFESAFSIIKSTPKSIPIVFQFDPHPQFQSPEIVDEICKRVKTNSGELLENVFFCSNLERKGFISQANYAFSSYPNSDIVLVNSDVVVGENYLESMLALLAKTDCATVSVLSNRGSILSIDTNLPERSEHIFDFTNNLNFKLKSNPIAKFPIIPVAVGHCLGITRKALQLIGFFDEVFGMGYGEEVDFSLRATSFGLNNYLADDTWVFHAGSKSFEFDASSAKKQNDKRNDETYPNFIKYREFILGKDSHPLGITLKVTNAKINGIRLAVNACDLNSGNTGTFFVMKNLIRHLSKNKNVSELYLILDLSDTNSESFKIAHSFKEEFFIKLLDINSDNQEFSKIDVSLNLAQVFDLNQWNKIFIKSYRSVIWQLDNIFFLNSDYGINFEQWNNVVTNMSTSLNNADGVAYLSRFVEAQMPQIGLDIPQNRTSVIYPGVDDFNNSIYVSDTKSSRLDAIDFPFILVLGTSFKHKNRPYVLRIFSVLSKIWNGKLVFAGPEPITGSSNELEREYIESIGKDFSDKVLDFGRVTDEEKTFLMKNAQVVIFPSITEGFGLIPFEALKHGTPTITSKGGSLNEISPTQGKFLSFTNLDSDVNCIQLVLTDHESRQTQLKAWKELDSKYNWTQTAEMFVNLALQVMALPQRTDKSKYIQNPPLKLGIEQAKFIDLVRIKIKSTLKKIILVSKIVKKIKSLSKS
jgi:glycosyltransferase involved in cell wall biosynthesis